MTRSALGISATFASRSRSASSLFFVALSSLARSFIAARSSAVNPFLDFVVSAMSQPCWVWIVMVFMAVTLRAPPWPALLELTEQLVRPQAGRVIVDRRGDDQLVGRDLLDERGQRSTH